MTSCLIFAFFFESVLLAQYIFVCLLFDLIAVCGYEMISNLLAFRGYPRKEPSSAEAIVTLV